VYICERTSFAPTSTSQFYSQDVVATSQSAFNQRQSAINIGKYLCKLGNNFGFPFLCCM